jgi:hypothetical protein
MRTVYADFNDIDEFGVLPLTCRGSLESLAALQPPPAEEEEVWLSDGEMRVVARLFLRPEGYWEARSKWKFASI